MVGIAALMLVLETRIGMLEVRIILLEEMRIVVLAVVVALIPREPTRAVRQAAIRAQSGQRLALWSPVSAVREVVIARVLTQPLIPQPPISAKPSLFGNALDG
jgi:hypothetical protein